VVLAVPIAIGIALPSRAQERLIRVLPPDEHHMKLPDPPAVPPAAIPGGPPTTVSDPDWDKANTPLGLDQAIRSALATSRVVRVLAGVTAVASGQTIYDPAITNTTIDQAKARFDPVLNVQNLWSQTHTPLAEFDPLDPTRAIIDGSRVRAYDFNMNLSKVNSLGGTAALGVDVRPTNVSPSIGLPLNPQTPSSVTLSYTQPLLQGAGAGANLAPIVIARLNTERSYFQFKDTMQQSVKGVIQAYWSLVFARTDVWTRQRQVEQNEEALRRAESRLRVGLADLAEVAQARSALANFRATLIGSEANLLNQEAAVAGIMGLPPSVHYLPISPPSSARLIVDWDGVVRLAEEHRPDLIELKLIIEADQQQLIVARNQARARLDATALYRWNGLEGVLPSGQEVSTHGGFNDWNLGVNFSVPLGLRAGRAGLRQQELILVRDRANLGEALLTASQLLALRVRTLAQEFEQYKAFQEARVAARQNLDRQLENYRRGRTILLNVLQAITDWGNAVSSESQALTQYNIEIANLEMETGTILETHGVRFFEERYRSVGPLGALGKGRCYPKAAPPGPNSDRYPDSDKPAEEFFNLQDPLRVPPLPPSEPLPAPRPAPGG
jgi:outer membrane protein TolC